MTIDALAVLQELEQAESELGRVPMMSEGIEHVMAAHARVTALRRMIATVWMIELKMAGAPGRGPAAGLELPSADVPST